MNKVSKPNKSKIKIYADGASLESMVVHNKNPLVKGFTTNPTLLKKAGVKNYSLFAGQVLAKIKTKPVSFEVFSDDLVEMERQARIISSWGKNVYVKIPVMNTKRQSTGEIIKRLSTDGIKVNVTAVFTVEQAKKIVSSLPAYTQAIISVFAGRIADTGCDPVPIMKKIAVLIKKKPKIELLWASSRELFNLFDAEASGADIITLSDEILKKLPMIGKNLTDVSLETVKMFYNDALIAAYTI